MKYLKHRVFFIITLFLIIFIANIPNVLAKPRKTYITDFLYENQIENDGFANSIRENTDISFEATAYASKLIYDLQGAFDSKINNTILQKNLESDIEQMFESKNVNTYDLHYLLFSLDIYNHSIDSNLKAKIKDYVDDSRSAGGGFYLTNTSSSKDLISTYFMIKIYSFINEKIESEKIHINWIKNQRNPDGGYGSITETYYAILSLSELNSLNEIINPDKTINYLNSSYIADKYDLNNYGGFLPDENAKHTLIWTTYLCIKAISLLNSSRFNNESIKNWVLNRQNFQDGGFTDIGDGYDQYYSSVTNTFFAIEILNMINANNIEEDVFMVEFNYWYLIIPLTIIGGIVSIWIFMWRSKKI